MVAGVGRSPVEPPARAGCETNLPFKLPTITNVSIRTLRPVFTRHLGAFVGRAIPIVGEVMLAKDVTVIM